MLSPSLKIFPGLYRESVNNEEYPYFNDNMVFN